MPEERKEIKQEIHEAGQDIRGAVQDMHETGQGIPGSGQDIYVADQKIMQKRGKKYFSRIGLAFLGGTVEIGVVQWLVVMLFYKIRPEWMGTSTTSLVITMLAMYLLAMPLMMFTISRIKIEVPVIPHKMSFGKWVLAAIMCYGITYAGNLAGTFLTLLIGMLKGSPVENIANSVIMENPHWSTFAIMVVCAPVFEELIFRKMLVDRVAVYGEGVAVVLSGLMFGLFHGNLNQFAYAFFLGIFWAFIYVKTRRIGYTIAMHMFVNALGSVVPILVMKISHYDEFMEALILMETNMAEGMAQLQAVMPGIILFAGYTLAILGLSFSGIVLLIVNHKKFQVMPGQRVVPKGKRFSTVILNVGMMLFCIIWIVQIVTQLIGV